jgi:hypothetical protein
MGLGQVPFPLRHSVSVHLKQASSTGVGRVDVSTRLGTRWGDWTPTAKPHLAPTKDSWAPLGALSFHGCPHCSHFPDEELRPKEGEYLCGLPTRKQCHSMGACIEADVGASFSQATWVIVGIGSWLV